MLGLKENVRDNWEEFFYLKENYGGYNLNYGVIV